MNNSSQYYSIVTGASQGLGRALATGLARRGHNLILVALPGTGLPELSSGLAERYGVSVHIIETDLMHREAPEELAGYIRDNALRIDVLVNNVGIGHGGETGDYSAAAIEESVFLNMRCTTLMTNIFAEELGKRDRAFILNLGSFGGFMPVPYKSIYSATKAYIYHYSLAVREELRGRGISVSVAMPGGIITNDRVRKRTTELGTVARSLSLEPDRAAEYIIKGMFRGRKVIIPGWPMRMAYGIGCLLPLRLLMALTGRMFRGVS